MRNTNTLYFFIGIAQGLHIFDRMYFSIRHKFCRVYCSKPCKGHIAWWSEIRTLISVGSTCIYFCVMPFNTFYFLQEVLALSLQSATGATPGDVSLDRWNFRSEPASIGNILQSTGLRRGNISGSAAEMLPFRDSALQWQARMLNCPSSLAHCRQPT